MVDTHRDQVIGALRRMFERFETEATRGSGLSEKARQRFVDDAGVLKDALHYLGVAEHVERAQAVQRKGVDPTLNALLNAMLPDLLLLLVGQQGGSVEVPVDLLDAYPKGKVLDMQIIRRVTGQAFVFQVRRK